MWTHSAVIFCMSTNFVILLRSYLRLNSRFVGPWALNRSWTTGSVAEFGVEISRSGMVIKCLIVRSHKSYLILKKEISM